MKRIYPTGWDTWDELEFIGYLGSDEPRQEMIPSLDLRILKVKAWIKTCPEREWGRNVNLAECYAHAEEVLNGLESQQQLEAV